MTYNYIMQFTKTDNIYKITRITGSQDNLLGISFAEKEIPDVEVIPLELNRPVLTTKDEVKKQVLAGLDSANQLLGTNYRLSHIYFVPSDSCASQIYERLISILIHHYHNGKEFIESKQKVYGTPEYLNLQSLMRKINAKLNAREVIDEKTIFEIYDCVRELFKVVEKLDPR